MMISRLASLLLVFLALTTGHATACYTTIFAFGDSLTDAGNHVGLNAPGNIPHMGFPPYGETYFHYPTGRCCDGRLIVDFIAETYGLPLLPPSIDMRSGNTNVRAGVNFAVVGSRALETEFYEERGIYDLVTNISMGTQFGWFKDNLQTFCNMYSSCDEMFQKSLILLGEFGGNDYTHALLSGKSLKEIEPFIPLVTHAIVTAAKDMIELGAVNIMVPGVLPLGCAASYLTYYPSPNKDDYDNMGCLVWMNRFAAHHNDLLQSGLDDLRRLYPNATIIYADYYNSAMRLYRNPRKYGFKTTLIACCGGGGPYNFNPSLLCGDRGSTACDDPSSALNWDAYHFTEAGNRWVAQGLFQESFTTPPINQLCLAKPSAAALDTSSGSSKSQ